MTTAPTVGVGATAVTMTMLRVLESSREDRLFDDPLAERLMHAAGYSMPLPWPYPDELLGEYFTVRTRFFDEVVRAAVKDGCRQVVLLAAGLDTRFDRLEWPDGLRLFEVDLPEVLRFKRHVLDAAGVDQSRRITVPADLTTAWTEPLAEAGFDANVPTAWLAEGLLFYLSRNDGDQLCARVRELSGPGSVLAFDHMSQGLFDSPAYRPRIEQSVELGAPWRCGLADPRAHLEGLGWDARVCDSAEIARSYGRQPTAIEPGPTGAPATMWLVSATVSEPWSAAARLSPHPGASR